MNVKVARTEGALLAGVCAGIAQALNWNVWVLRALFVAFLLIKTLWAIVLYAGLALAFHLINCEWRGRKNGSGLSSPELSGRNERIADLERRFREMEEDQDWQLDRKR
jgi:phage shock protein PspC (stress-responsive transcriptional regulator)